MRQAWVVPVFVLTACGREQVAPQTSTRSTTEVEASAPDAYQRVWPTRSIAPPAELAAWPEQRYEVLVQAHPQLDSAEDMRKLRLSDLEVVVEPSGPPGRSRMFVTGPGLGLRVLEDAWGQAHGRMAPYRVWFSPSAGVRAFYPARHRVLKESVELAPYEPLLPRLKAMPDDFGRGPLLGNPSEALNVYAEWMLPISDEQNDSLPPEERSSNEDIKIDIIYAPAGEWDPEHTTIAVSTNKKTNLIWSVSFRAGLGSVDPSGEQIKSLLVNRFGQPTTKEKRRSDVNEIWQWKTPRLYIEMYTTHPPIETIKVSFERPDLRSR